MKIVKVGLFLIIAVTVNGCAGYKSPELIPVTIDKEVIEVCILPEYARTLPQFPTKPVPEDGNRFITNAQNDIYQKVEVNIAYVCEVICRTNDMLFVCGGGQQQLIGVPIQCMDSNGELDCSGAVNLTQ